MNTNHRILSLTLSVVAALSFACGGVETSDDTAVVESDIRRLSKGDQFIREAGLDGELCYEGAKSKIQCVSADRKRPIAIGDRPTNDFYLCNEASRGKLASCQPEPVPYGCGLGGCTCVGYADCWLLATEKNCGVQVLPCAGCPLIGWCSPGQ